MMLTETMREASPKHPFLSNLFAMFSPKSPHKPMTKNKTRRSSEFERVFRYFDEDGDGKISAAELRNCMRRTVGEELSAEDAEAVVGSTDSDGDGLLGLEDFARLVEAGGEEEKGRNLREAFEVYQVRGGDCITPTSLRRALSLLGQPKSVEECEAMIRSFDLDGDGVISFDEFRIMML